MTKQVKEKFSWQLLLALLIWVLLWSQVPLLTWEWARPGYWLFRGNAQAALGFDIGWGLALMITVMYFYRRFQSSLFRLDKTAWALGLPLVFLLILPLRAGGFEAPIFGNPAWLYMLFAPVSVLMQQYSTFGFLQSALGEQLSVRWTVILTGLVFFLGHVLFIPSKFAPVSLAAGIAGATMLPLGILFAGIRQSTKTLYITVALHSAFYMVMI